MRARGILFDLDGTLIDSAPLIAGIINAMLAARGTGRRVTPGDARPHLTRSGEQLVAAMLAADATDPAQDIAEFRDLYAARPTPATCLYDGVRDGLEALGAAGVAMAICSNKPQPLCEKVVRDLALGPLFAAVAGSMPDRPLKPAPAIGARALEAMGLGAHEVTYVGDSEVDRQTAAALGTPFLHVGYGYAEAHMVREGFPTFVTFGALVAHHLAEAA